jgi:hypothetical protein
MKSMLKRMMLWPLVVVGCSASNPAVSGGAGAAPDGAAAAVELDALRSRLPVPPVGAFVRLRGKLYPSAALQEAPQPRRFAKIGFGGGLKFVEDQGSALKLAVQGDFEIEVFVAREQLLPVLAEEVAQVFADGSGYVACPGLRVGLVEGRLVAAAKGLSDLPVQFPESKVALGFDTLECSSLPTLPQESLLGCVAGEPLQPLRRDQYQNCGVRDWAGELPPPTLNGAPVEPSIVPLVRGTTVHRHEDRLLISLLVPESQGADRARLQLRVVGRPSHVEEPPGMGRLGRGPARGPRVRSGTAVYFHDGTLAGRYVGSELTLEDEPAGTSTPAADANSSKVCVAAPVEGGLCFARADLEAAEVRERRSEVSLGNVTVGEGRTVSEVTSVVSRSLPGIRSCHETSLRAGKLSSGEVIVDFTILEHGQVASVSTENHLPDAEVAACIARIFENKRFPAIPIETLMFGVRPKRMDVAVRVPLVLRVAAPKP